jgi:hypothetical protein
MLNNTNLDVYAYVHENNEREDDIHLIIVLDGPMLG